MRSVSLKQQLATMQDAREGIEKLWRDFHRLEIMCIVEDTAAAGSKQDLHPAYHVEIYGNLQFNSFDINYM